VSIGRRSQIVFLRLQSRRLRRPRSTRRKSGDKEIRGQGNPGTKEIRGQVKGNPGTGLTFQHSTPLTVPRRDALHQACAITKPGTAVVVNAGRFLTVVFHGIHPVSLSPPALPAGGGTGKFAVRLPACPALHTMAAQK
jgi:hypothetical protein